MANAFTSRSAATLLALLLVVARVAPCFAGPKSDEPNADLRYTTPTDREILAMLQEPEDHIDIGLDALRLSSLVLSDVDVPKGVEILNEIAARVAKLVGDRTDPDVRIRAINTVLYRQLGFHYDFDELESGHKLETPLLWNLLKTGKGNCAALPVLWYAVAERLNYPVYFVDAPQHVFIRYDDGTYRSNIEATNGGGEASDEQYIADLEISPEALRSGAYMRSLTKREAVAALVAGIGERLLDLHDYGDAISALHNALVNFPNNISANWNLAMAYNTQGYVHAADRALSAKEPYGHKASAVDGTEDFLLALKYANQATALGAPKPLDKDYWKHVRKLGDKKLELKAPPKPFDVASLLKPLGARIQINVQLPPDDSIRQLRDLEALRGQAPLSRGPALSNARGPGPWRPDLPDFKPQPTREPGIAECASVCSQFGMRPSRPPDIGECATVCSQFGARPCSDLDGAAATNPFGTAMMQPSFGGRGMGSLYDDLGLTRPDLRNRLRGTGMMNPGMPGQPGFNGGTWP